MPDKSMRISISILTHVVPLSALLQDSLNHFLSSSSAVESTRQPADEMIIARTCHMRHGRAERAIMQGQARSCAFARLDRPPVTVLLGCRSNHPRPLERISLVERSA
jgi:hypothetical protein